MKVSAHLGAISWSMADKMLYVGYGFVQFLQIAALPKEVYGVFTLLVALNSWIMMVSDGSALAGVIQFGVDVDERPRVNMLAMLIHIIVVMGSSGLMFVFSEPLTELFHVREFALVAQWLPLYCLLTIPRMFCLKILYRDMRMRDLFVADAIWFGVRTFMTIWAISHGGLNTFEDILLIDLVGIGASSLVSMVMTRREMIFSSKGMMTLRTYLGYGLPLAAATALNTAPRLLDVYVIAAFFDVGVVGVYNPAKNLYRIFEQGFDAVTTLMYPAAVRMFAQRRIEDLQTLVTKAVSFTLLPVIVIVAILELGASNLIITFLKPEYAAAVGHFDVLTLSALIMPFGLLGTIILAMGQSASILRYSSIGVVSSFAVLILVGYAEQPGLVGLGLVANTLIVSLFYTVHVKKSLDLPMRAFSRVLPDARNLLRRFHKGVE